MRQALAYNLYDMINRRAKTIYLSKDLSTAQYKTYFIKRILDSN